MNAMPFSSVPSRGARTATQSEIAISRVLTDMKSDQFVRVDPALCVACPSCEALSHQRFLERNPRVYVAPHAGCAALVTGAATRDCRG